ncbi:MAG: AarF/ABC1/UbiB kinase family protein [Proteobacteria bacterium]|nr:AarF/ABC1/UbiB kinase family protein [Pseudomonadota bacterium]
MALGGQGADGSFGGRIRRYAQVGSSVGGLAARLAGARYLGVTLDREKHAADLARVLGGLKGPLMKVAQLMATIPDALPEEYLAHLGKLQSQAPPMGWGFVKRRMRAEFGRDWQARFTEFEHEATAAASLGQVHRAIGLDGRRLACKLQYPDMRSVVEADLAQLKLVFALYRRYDPTIDPTQIHAELTARLREELDYEREARHMALYALMLADEPEVHVPELVPELSSARLLTMTWLEGAPLLSVLERPLEERNRVARNMFRAWYRPFYRYGVIHGDPHLGNYSVRPGGAINLLDFGCIRLFAAKFVQGVIDLYRAIERNDQDLAVHAYETWGFHEISTEMVDVLNIWAKYLYGPLLDDRVRLIQEEPSGTYGAGVAAKVHVELRRLGGVTPPREFVLVDRAAIGLGAVFLHLKAEINWHRLFEELIAGFEPGVMAGRQGEALRASGFTADHGRHPSRYS